MKSFLVNYRYGGQRYALEIPAADAAEAKDRLGSLLYGQVLGEVVGKVPASIGLLASLICLLRNAFAR